MWSVRRGSVPCVRTSSELETVSGEEAAVSGAALDARVPGVVAGGGAVTGAGAAGARAGATASGVVAAGVSALEPGGVRVSRVGAGTAGCGPGETGSGSTGAGTLAAGGRSERSLERRGTGLAALRSAPVSTG
jgi:hypothetical protein